MIAEKRIFSNWTDLTTFLTSNGFTISNDEMYWTASGRKSCHWTVDSSNEIINFVNCEEDEIFEDNLVDFSNSNYAGLYLISLIDNGCILYLTQLQENDLANLNIASYGAVAVTPTEDDGYWYHTYQVAPDPEVTGDYYKWCADNGNSFSIDHICPHKRIIPVDVSVTIVKGILDSGVWSKYIYNLVMGSVNPPDLVFKLNGQRFLCLTDNNTYRCPAFRLEAVEQGVNPSNSTEEYSKYKTYKVGDYCVYDGFLWKCKKAITTPKPFDGSQDGDWFKTTVAQEKYSLM